MTLSKYADALVKFLARNPDLADKEAFYCIDDEGNGYKPVNFTPSKVKVEDISSVLDTYAGEEIESKFITCIN